MLILVTGNRVYTGNAMVPMLQKEGFDVVGLENGLLKVVSLAMNLSVGARAKNFAPYTNIRKSAQIHQS